MRIPLVYYSVGVTEAITPECVLPPVPEIPRGCIVIVEGRAPIWRHCMAFHLLHGTAAAAVASYDPRLGAVIVASHSPIVKEGDVLDIQIGQPFVER